MSGLEANNVVLSILIVNFNGKRFLTDCLRSIEEFTSCSHEVIIVDNASSDGSAEFIAQNFPNVRLIQSKKNLGFTGGNNLGADAAKGRILLLLNNDTVILKDLKTAIDELDNSTVGVVGAHLYYGDGRNQPSVGYEHTPWRLILSWLGMSAITWLPSIFRRTESSEDFYASPKANVAWVSGAFLLTRLALWRQLGGLDDRYFMYVEDVDYCKRARQSGYSISYLSDMKVTHYEGGGKSWLGEAALLRSMRSYLIYLRKFHTPFAASLTSTSLGLVMLARAASYALQGGSKKSHVTGEKMRAYFKAGRYLIANPAIER
ncbi:MAG: glycosyltransferase family 2 protein [Burkholderiales bacterium]|nr:glycosyltransferase family 2 protein [Burkholderiales bacterium]